MFTKKHYKAIAEILKEHKDDYYKATYVEFDFDNLIENFCRFFKEDNPRFDKEKFLEACRG